MLLGQKINSLNHKKINHRKVFENTIGQEAPQSASSSASLTVEAALVFPLFLFATVGMLFFFRVLQVEHMTYGALCAAGSRMSLETGEGEGSLVKAVGYFYGKLAQKDFSYRYIVSGKAGMRWRETELSGEYIDLRLQYDCKIPVPLFGQKKVPIAQKVRIKKWTGYQGNAGESGQEQWVYVAENGTVYHLTRTCTHLQLSIHSIGKNAAKQAGYGPCERCTKEQDDGVGCYITDEGERYHTKLSCSGLKRTVYMVRLSDVGGEKACSRCGGG